MWNHVKRKKRHPVRLNTIDTWIGKILETCWTCIPKSLYQSEAFVGKSRHIVGQDCLPWALIQSLKQEVAAAGVWEMEVATFLRLLQAKFHLLNQLFARNLPAVMVRQGCQRSGSRLSGKNAMATPNCHPTLKGQIRQAIRQNSNSINRYQEISRGQTKFTCYAAKNDATWWQHPQDDATEWHSSWLPSSHSALDKALNLLACDRGNCRHPARSLRDHGRGLCTPPRCGSLFCDVAWGRESYTIECGTNTLNIIQCHTKYCIWLLEVGQWYGLAIFHAVSVQSSVSV